jgi:hypothetical protein
MFAAIHGPKTIPSPEQVAGSLFIAETMFMIRYSLTKKPRG